MRKPNRHEIIFFEKNGLRHGEFTLPFGVKEVEVCSHAESMHSIAITRTFHE